MPIFPWPYFQKTFKVGFFFLLLEALVLYLPNHSSSLKAANLIMRGLKKFINFPVAPCLQSPCMSLSNGSVSCLAVFLNPYSGLQSPAVPSTNRRLGTKSTTHLEIQITNSLPVLVASIIFQMI